MSAFSVTELLILDAPDLYDLLQLAPGEELAVRAAYLGLDLAMPIHRQAVERACASAGETVQPFSPPIGAAQLGVRSDRTPTAADLAGPAEGNPEADDDAL